MSRSVHDLIGRIIAGPPARVHPAPPRAAAAPAEPLDVLIGRTISAPGSYMLRVEPATPGAAPVVPPPPAY